MNVQNSQPLPPIRWRNPLILIALPIALVVLSVWQIASHWSTFTWLDVLGAAVWFAVGVFLCIVSVCIKHRLYSHKNGGFIKKSAETFYAVISVVDIQGSILRWATDHRHHHHGEDPHDIKRGWWWACYGWMMRYYPDLTGMDADLKKNTTLVWQDKHYGLLLLLACYVPLFTVATLAEIFTPIGFWQVVLPFVGAQVITQQNTIFFVNVLSHFPKLGISYDETQATDLRGPIGLYAGIFTGGEGRRHGRHHLMPNQPFLGHFDWTGWVLRGMAKLKLIHINVPYRLREVPDVIRQKLAERKQIEEARRARRETSAAA